jgi:hypothetical protein
MALDPSAQLKNYIEHIIGKNCTEPEIIEIFRLIRHVIEKDRSRSEYPHLSLYCDWVQHIEIDRHPQGFAILEGRLVHERPVRLSVVYKTGTRV